MHKISIIGLGSWGTALAIYLNSKKHSITLYGREEDNFDNIESSRRHPLLKGKKISKSIFLTKDLRKTLKNNHIILAVPSQAIKKVLKEIMIILPNEEKKIINVSKGMDISSGQRISEIVFNESNGMFKYSVLSGPTHAEEVIREKPTAAVVASNNASLIKDIQNIFNSETFKIYTSRDVLGVELCGILKNIIAIAAGFIDGMRLGDNAKSFLITKGIQEMIMLGKFLGAEKQTFIGLAGIGDLITTCISKHSRNRSFGENFAKRKITKSKMIIEGVYATKAIYNLSKKIQIPMPITEEVYKVLYKKKDILKSIKSLMSRKVKIEMEGIF